MPGRKMTSMVERERISTRNSFHAISQMTFNDRTLGTVRQTCDYDDHDNPLSCELQVIDESVQPPLTRHYTIKNRIDYY